MSRETALTRLAGQLFRKPVLGPRELFYADIFASRQTGCRSQMGLPGIRDQHSGCVGAWLAARDLYDFLLLSLPDNDTHCHKNGPHAQATSIAAADAQIMRVADAAGGLQRFLDTHAVVVCADHSHAAVERTIDLRGAFAEDWAIAGPGGARGRGGRAGAVPQPARGDGVRLGRGGPRRDGPEASSRPPPSSRAST